MLCTCIRSPFLNRFSTTLLYNASIHRFDIWFVTLCIIYVHRFTSINAVYNKLCHEHYSGNVWNVIRISVTTRGYMIHKTVLWVTLSSTLTKWNNSKNNSLPSAWLSWRYKCEFNSFVTWELCALLSTEQLERIHLGCGDSFYVCETCPCRMFLNMSFDII